MPNYRRARVPGASYFFTVNLHDRSSDLLLREIDLLRDCVRACKSRHPFHINAWVVLPEHMHCMWTLPEARPGIRSALEGNQVFLRQTPAHHRAT